MQCCAATSARPTKPESHAKGSDKFPFPLAPTNNLLSHVRQKVVGFINPFDPRNFPGENALPRMSSANIFNAEFVNTIESRYIEKKAYLSRYSHERTIALRDSEGRLASEFGNEEKWFRTVKEDLRKF